MPDGGGPALRPGGGSPPGQFVSPRAGGATLRANLAARGCGEAAISRGVAKPPPGAPMPMSREAAPRDGVASPRGGLPASAPGVLASAPGILTWHRDRGRPRPAVLRRPGEAMAPGEYSGHPTSPRKHSSAAARSLTGSGFAHSRVQADPSQALADSAWEPIVPGNLSW